TGGEDRIRGGERNKTFRGHAARSGNEQLLRHAHLKEALRIFLAKNVQVRVFRQIRRHTDHIRTFLGDLYKSVPKRGGACSLPFSGNGRNHRGRRSEEHTSELQSRENLVCRLLLEK